MKLVSITLALAFLFSCSKQNEQKEFSIYNSPVAQLSAISSWSDLAEPQAQAQIVVVNTQNEPLAQAEVLIGRAQGSPFKNNFLKTDKNGVVTIPKEWTQPAHVTVQAAGYIRQTLLNQKPGQIVVKMNPAYLANKALVTGQVTQLPVVNGDKMIDFGLVMSALTRADLLNFDFGLVISPFNDVLTVAGYNAPVPSNVSLPTQKESYIFNLTVSKPQYRYFSSTLGQRRMYAAGGRFPFKAVVDELRGGKPFYEVINYFDLKSGGIRDVTLNGQQTQVDIPGNELTFNQAIQITSPTIEADEVYVALAASELGGFLIPTGLKKMPSNTTATLNTLASQPSYVVSVLKKQSEFMSQAPGSDRLTASLLPYKAGQKTTLIPLIADPAISFQNNAYQIQMPPVEVNTGIYPLAISAAVSDIQTVTEGDKTITHLIRQWEILGTEWPENIELPQWPLAATQGKRRLEVNYVAGNKDQNLNLGEELLKAATHVTHSSTDF